MRKFLGAASFVAAAAAMSTAVLFADSGNASETEIKSLTSNDIIVDPALVEPTQAEEVPIIAETAEEKAEKAAAEDIVKAENAAELAKDAEKVQAEEAVEEDITQQDRPQKAGSLRELVNLQSTPKSLGKELDCLAGAVYFESKGETLEGQLAVAEVILKRKASSRFPNSICGVVFQKSQFSFVRGGRMPYIDKSGKNWNNAAAIAQIAYDGSWASSVNGSLFFHAKYVSPGWRLKRVGTVGNHIFYR